MSKRIEWIEKRLSQIQGITKYSSESNREYAQSNEQKIIKPSELIKLDSNENLFVPRKFLSEILKEVERDIDPRLYPQKEKLELINSLSEYQKLSPECFLIGNGSDELIETVIRCFLTASKEAISISPTFSMYKIIVETNGNIYDAIQLKENFQLDPESILLKTTSKTAICFLCSPNNPTGNQFEESSIMKIVQEFNGIVVVDEAYVEFAKYSVKDAVNKFKNLVILKTFSKAFGLAGLRVGYAIASPEIVSSLRQIQLPYNINKFSMKVASKVLQERQIPLEAIERIKIERSRLIKNLNKVPSVKAFNSDANFVLFETERNTEKIHEGLGKKGILVRKIGDASSSIKYLRVTVGLPKMNDGLIEVLTKLSSS